MNRKGQTHPQSNMNRDDPHGGHRKNSPIMWDFRAKNQTPKGGGVFLSSNRIESSPTEKTSNHRRSNPGGERIDPVTKCASQVEKQQEGGKN